MKYYQPLFYDSVYQGKKRGRKTKEEKQKYLDSQRLKINYGLYILDFD